MPDSPAARAGLAANDRVYAVNGAAFHGNDEFGRLIAASNGPLELRVERRGWVRSVVLRQRCSSILKTISRNDFGETPVGASLQKSDHRSPDTRSKHIPFSGIGNYFRAVERRTQPGGMGNLSAKPASDTTLQNGGDRVFSKRIPIWCDRKGRAPRKANAGMVTSARVWIYAKLLAH